MDAAMILVCIVSAFLLRDEVYPGAIWLLLFKVAEPSRKAAT